MDEWIEQYKTDSDSGMCAIMQFFISASGCKGNISAQMQSSMEHSAIINQMTEEFDKVSSIFKIKFAVKYFIIILIFRKVENILLLCLDHSGKSFTAILAISYTLL